MGESSPRKKIVLIPSWYPSRESPYGGIFVREQARCLAQRFDVTVLTPRFPGLVDLVRLRWGPELIQEEDVGIHVWRVRKLKVPTLRRFLPLLASPDHAFVYYRKFVSAVRRGFHRYVAQRGLPDVIHAHVVAPAGWVAVELGKEFGVPVVITEHSEPFAPMHLGTPRLRAMVRDVLVGADRIVAVSGPLRADIRAFCPDVRVDVIGNVIDTEFFTPAPAVHASRSALRFFFLGVLIERKGVQHLFQAARTLRAQGFTDFEIRLGGDGSSRAMLEELAEKLGIQDRCRFLGMLDRGKVRDEMRACDVFVLPSLGETFGIVLGEAMACGKPVLSTRCGGPEEVVTSETGILVAPGDADELADAMAGFLTQRFSFHADAIRNSVTRRFGQAAFVVKSEKLYSDVMCRAEPAKLGKAG